MSQHPSLARSGAGGAHRSVLKRYERIKILLERKRWTEGASVFGLPKVKTIKIRIRKEKAATEEKAAAPGAAPGATPAAGAPTTAGKASGTKEPAKGK